MVVEENKLRKKTIYTEFQYTKLSDMKKNIVKQKGIRDLTCFLSSLYSNIKNSIGKVLYEINAN